MKLSCFSFYRIYHQILEVPNTDFQNRLRLNQNKADQNNPKSNAKNNTMCIEILMIHQ